MLLLLLRRKPRLSLHGARAEITATAETRVREWRAITVSKLLSSEVTCNTKISLSVETNRPGYPRYSALIAVDKSFHLCRSFTTLRSRLLLVKQDKLALLEEQLQNIDKEETCPLFLQSRRLDMNPERERLLSEIDTALAGYGA